VPVSVHDTDRLLFGEVTLDADGREGPVESST
jgi:hypothetical protein